MRVIIQRVSRASVHIEGLPAESIAAGIVALVAIGRNNKENDADFRVAKIATIRILPDEEGKMNKSLLDTGGDLLIVSNFTLYGDCRKGRRLFLILPRPPRDVLVGSAETADLERRRKHHASAVRRFVGWFRLPVRRTVYALNYGEPIFPSERWDDLTVAENELRAAYQQLHQELLGTIKRRRVL